MGNRVLGQLAEEATRNLRAAGRRTTFEILFVSLILGATVLWESQTVSDIRRDEATFVASGAYVTRVSSKTQLIDGPACQRLSAQPGILRAGTYTDGGLLPVSGSPGVAARIVYVSAGTLGVLTRDQPTIASTGVWLGPGLAAELRIRVGATIMVADEKRRVLGILRPGRSDPVARAIVVDSGGPAKAAECWLESSRPYVSYVIPLARAAFAQTAGIVRGERLADPPAAAFNEVHRLRTRGSRIAVPIGTLVLVTAFGLGRRQRRSDLALYRALGASRAFLVGLELATSVILVAVPLAWASAIAVVRTDGASTGVVLNEIVLTTTAFIVTQALQTLRPSAGLSDVLKQ